MKRREGRVVRDSPEAVADEIFATLRDEGWLDHLRPAAPSPAPRRRRRLRGVVIPLRYRLRDGVRVEEAAAARGGWSRSFPSACSPSTRRLRACSSLRARASVADLAAALVCRGEDPRALRAPAPPRGAGGRARAGRRPRPLADRDRHRADPGPGDDLADCLQALGRLDYPRDRLEVIVVDDASLEPGAVAAVAARYGARLLVNEQNHGPAASRNRAAREARGEILAFVDSDCVAGGTGCARLVRLLRLGARGSGRGQDARLLHRVTARSLRGSLVVARHGRPPADRGRGQRHLLRAHLQPAGAPDGLRWNSTVCATTSASAKTSTSAGASGSAATTWSTRRREWCGTSTATAAGHDAPPRRTAARRPDSTRSTPTNAGASRCRRRLWRRQP